MANSTMAPNAMTRNRSRWVMRAKRARRSASQADRRRLSERPSVLNSDFPRSAVNPGVRPLA